MQHLIFLILFSFCTGTVFAAGIVQNLQSLIDQKLYQQAARSGELLLEDHAGNAEIEFLTAYALQMTQQNSRASKLYRKLIRRNPELPEPRNNLAMIYLSNGDYDRASELLVNAINSHTSYATAYANLSNIYTGLASEAYRRAVNESNQPVNYASKIELTALTRLIPLNADKPVGSISNPELTENSAIEPILTRQVIGWAQAWSEKNLDAYLNYYSTEHKLNFATHEDWIENRKQRILRPGFIKIGISDIQIRAQTENLAIIDFQQSFYSLDYSDRVTKRLGLRRINSQWKITDERVLSVL
jgi:tetratricopeptide (TPR) repeat protein